MPESADVTDLRKIEVEPILPLSCLPSGLLDGHEGLSLVMSSKVTLGFLLHKCLVPGNKCQTKTGDPAEWEETLRSTFPILDMYDVALKTLALPRKA